LNKGSNYFANMPVSDYIEKLLCGIFFPFNLLGFKKKAPPYQIERSNASDDQVVLCSDLCFVLFSKERLI